MNLGNSERQANPSREVAEQLRPIPKNSVSDEIVNQLIDLISRKVLKPGIVYRLSGNCVKNLVSGEPQFGKLSGRCRLWESLWVALGMEHSYRKMTVI